MQKLLFVAALTSGLLVPGGAAFAQNVSSAHFTPTWCAAELTDPTVAALLAASQVPPALMPYLSPSGLELATDADRMPPTSSSSTGQAIAPESEKVQGSFRSRLLERTFAFLGVPYKWGGTKAEEGFDCSGFVRQVVADVTGRILPRTAKEQSEVGAQVSRKELKPGDLVFFNTMRRAFSHVGIYLGNNLFAHAPRRGQTVRIDSLTDDYWVKTYEGARRPVTM